MNDYIERLIACGYTADWATNVYNIFMRNFTIAELEIHVRYVEECTYVGAL